MHHVGVAGFYPVEGALVGAGALLTVYPAVHLVGRTAQDDGDFFVGFGAVDVGRQADTIAHWGHVLLLYVGNLSEFEVFGAALGRYLGGAAGAKKE